MTLVANYRWIEGCFNWFIKRLERFSQTLINPADGCPGVILTPDQERELKTILGDSSTLSNLFFKEEVEK